ncbi:MAG: flagellar basal body rod C-terminal domain-containing protein [Desulfobacteraceae bacterium]
MAIQGINSAASAIKAFGTKMASTADNVANAQSRNFKKTRVVMSETDTGQGVKADVSRVKTPGTMDSSGNERSNVNTAEELVSMIPTEQGLKANVKAVQTMDETTGAIIDTMG